VDTAAEEESEATIREHILPGGGEKAVTAFVSIMQGCNQYCTFCIVPHTRGEERSRRIPDIVAECRGLVACGVKEITLLGQIVTSYGKRDLPVKDGKSAFVQLIEAVHAIDGLERIRFTSPHPKGYGEDLVEAYGRLPKLVESAHLPVQSGSDRILKAMHRGYTRERYAKVVGQLRAVKSGMGVTTDLIVGFPARPRRTSSRRFPVPRSNSIWHLSSYSQRRDTPAAAMPNQVPEPVIDERHQRLFALINEVAAEKYGATSAGRWKSWWKARAGRMPRVTKAGRVATRSWFSPAANGTGAN
jgi:tRNA-2-methylthio-N6-dimethylallyladenosine synthase